MQFLNKVVEMTVVVQRQVSKVQVVQKAVGQDERIATGRVAACRMTSTAEA